MICSLIAFALSLVYLPLIGCPIPQDVDLFHATLPNGVQLYSKQHEDSQNWASLRVIFRYQGQEHAIFSFDSKEADSEAIDEFFSACTQQLSPGVSHDSLTQNFSASVNRQAPCKIGIIAIGSFPQELIEEKVEHHFASLPLSSTAPLLNIETSSEIDPGHVAISLSFPLSHSLVTFEDLRNFWKYLFLQEMLESRLEECTKRMNQSWIHPHPRGIYPAHGYALTQEESTKNLVSFFFWHLEQLRNTGVCDDAFSLKKQELLYRLSYIHSQQNHPACSLLASYCTDLFLLGASNLHFPSFIAASLEEVEKMEETDLFPLFLSFLDKNQQSLHLIYSTSSRIPRLDPSDIDCLQQTIFDLAQEKEAISKDEENPLFPFTFAAPAVLCSHHQSSDSPQFMLAAAAQSSFYKLPLSSKEQELITSIITTMGENNVFQLAMQKSSMEKKGKKIDHVHPLRFMGHILSNPTLKNHLKTIRKSSFKWDALISGFSKKMREQLSKNNVYPHLDGFAALVGTTKEQITPYIQKSDFEGLVKSLL